MVDRAPVASSDKARFYAFGRVFSVRSALARRSVSSYLPREKDDLFVKSVQRTVLAVDVVRE